jgi:uncharacterized protein YbjT (DUF2867 family)
MAHSDQPILVTGGTGHQGGAAARHLLADGWRVRALVRDPMKPAAQALADAGAELFVGDLRDRTSVDAAMQGVYGAYSVQSLADGPEAELLESRNLGDSALASGVRHFVYSSVIGADRESALPWVVGKVEMEHYLRGLGLPLTIWRPVTFMENLLARREQIMSGVLEGPEPPDTVKQWIAVDDIGRFVASAFREPDTWIGRATEIASDELTGRQAAASLAQAWGTSVEYRQAASPGSTPAEQTGPPPNRADLAALRDHVPDLQTMGRWAVAHREALRRPATVK